MIKIAKIKKTISIDASLYNDCQRRMRLLRIDDFSKFVGHVLRENSDSAILARAKAKELFSLAQFYIERARTIEELQEAEREDLINVKEASL